MSARRLPGLARRFVRPVPGRTGPAGAAPGRRYRRDVQGLRAVAILAVVGYHAAVPDMGGGYVGVDVFFVISGYLITSLLFRELATRGTLSFWGFYARRARRILPSAVLVVLATSAASVALLSPLRAATVLRDGLSAALYAANYRFAVEATSYLSRGGPVSPFLHYWSLGVEEQFYLLWPALLVGVTLYRRRRARPGHVRAARHHERRLRGAALLGLCAVALASFGASLWLTRVDEPWAFYSLATRAWELAGGGAVALAEPFVSRLPRPAASLLGWAGVGAIVYAVVGFSSATPFPGTAALFPVGGAMAVVAAGGAEGGAGPALLLATRPAQWVGDVSYTWYLWHWPALVLAPAVVGHQLALPERLEVVAVSLCLAVATTLAVERPLWHSVRLAVPWRGLLTGAGASVVAAALLVSAAVALPASRGSGHVRHSALALRQLPRPEQVESPLTLARATAQDLTAQVQSLVRSSLLIRQVPANIDPPLTQAAADEATPFADGCFDGFTTTAVNTCRYGDTSSPRSIVLFGDSHALMWFPAFDNIATSEGWLLVAAAKATCPPVDLQIFSPDLEEPYVQCTQWRDAEVARIRALHPAVVVLGFSREYGVGNDHVLVDGAAWMEGLSTMIRTLRQSGAKVVVMGDVPYPSGLVPECLATHLTDATACLVPKAPPNYDVAGIAEERAVVTKAGGSYLDTEPWFCAAKDCAALVENMLVYRDDNHITASYATWLTPVIHAELTLATGLSLPPAGASQPSGTSQAQPVASGPVARS